MATTSNPKVSEPPPQDKLEGAEQVLEAGRVRECGEVALMRLSEAFGEALKQAGEQLFNKSLHGSTFQEQEKWFKAAEFVRSRRPAMVDAFRKLFEQRYPAACKRQPALLSSRVLDFDASQLKIEAHVLLENGLNPAGLVEAIRNCAWTAMHQLTEWFRGQLGDPELSPNDMPVGAKLVGTLSSQAIEAPFGVPALKELVLAQLCRTLPERVNLVYRDLAAHVANLPPEEPAPSASAPECPVTPPRDEAPEPASPGAPTFCADDEAEALEASRAASEVLDPWLVGKRLPGFIGDFLNGPWRTVLATIHQQHGSISPEWDEAAATLEALMDSLRIKPTQALRSQLMKSLPDLVRRLGKGLDHIGEPEEARRLFFARLADYHLKLLQKSRTVSPPPQPAPETAQAATPADPAQLTTLQTGTWLEVRTPQGAFQKLKLAWISPQRNLFLLTNTLGERVLSLGAPNFAALLREGNARILPSEAGKPGAILGGKPQFRNIG